MRCAVASTFLDTIRLSDSVSLWGMRLGSRGVAPQALGILLPGVGARPARKAHEGDNGYHLGDGLMPTHSRRCSTLSFPKSCQI